MALAQRIPANFSHTTTPALVRHMAELSPAKCTPEEGEDGLPVKFHWTPPAQRISAEGTAAWAPAPLPAEGNSVLRGVDQGLEMVS